MFLSHIFTITIFRLMQNLEPISLPQMSQTKFIHTLSYLVTISARSLLERSTAAKSCISAANQKVHEIYNQMQDIP